MREILAFFRVCRYWINFACSSLIPKICQVPERLLPIFFLACLALSGLETSFALIVLELVRFWTRDGNNFRTYFLPSFYRHLEVTKIMGKLIWSSWELQKEKMVLELGLAKSSLWFEF